MHSAQPQAGKAQEPERVLIIAGSLRGLTGTIVRREERRLTIALDGCAGVLAVVEPRAVKTLNAPVPPGPSDPAP